MFADIHKKMIGKAIVSIFTIFEERKIKKNSNPLRFFLP